jgi:hypothetical protein
LDHLGRIIGWDCSTANVHDSQFHPLIARYEEKTVVFYNHGFYSLNGNPSNLKVCERYRYNKRIIIDTVLSMLTTVCHFKKVAHCLWQNFKACLALTMAAYNLLVQRDGLQADSDGFVHLSIAQFSL